MLDSAKDVGIGSSKLLDIAGDYVHHEHHYHYQNPKVSFNGSKGPLQKFFELAFAVNPEPKHQRSPRVEDILGRIRKARLEAEKLRLKINLKFEIDPEPELKSEAKDPRSKLRRNIQDLQKKRRPKSLNAAKRNQTEHRKSSMPSPTHGTRSSNVLYSTDPANAKHSNHETDAGEEKTEHSPGPHNVPFPLNSYKSPDFDVYDELYQNFPDADTDWESHSDLDPYPDSDPYPDYSDSEEPPTSLPPPHIGYWHACNAWYAWYAHCMASWQASMAAWTATLMSWSPPWLGMCAPSWLGAWAPWR